MTPSQVEAVSGNIPFSAVLGAGGRLLAAVPSNSGLARGVARNQLVRSALAGSHEAVSNLLAPARPRPAGFLFAAPYATPNGRRLRASWLPLALMTASRGR